MTLEICAGIADKNGEALEQTAAREVQEECGYKISQPLKLIQSFIGTEGHKMTLFYAEVTNDDKVSPGQSDQIIFLAI